MPYAAVSSGTADGDYDRLCEVLNNIEGVNFICLDVANGYSQFFVEFVTKVRKTFPSHTIMVSYRIICTLVFRSVLIFLSVKRLF